MSKNFEYVYDETNTLSNILVDNKPVKRSFLLAFKKAMTTPIFSFVKNPVIGRNPFSGAEVELNPLEATIYQFCIRWYRGYEYGKMPTPVQTYDNMKYFLLDINPSAYMDLLD